MSPHQQTCKPRLPYTLLNMDSYVGRKYIEEEMHSNCESKEIPKGRQIGPSLRHLPGANAYPMLNDLRGLMDDLAMLDVWKGV